jgi:antitoxin (DNA-binding transcriptional repressor) of toxin-antitoxin stability system
MIFTVHQAKTNLSKLIAAALDGEDVVIARGDKPVVRLAPLVPASRKRVFGAFKGQFELTDAFFEPLPDDEEDLWNGRAD